MSAVPPLYALDVPWAPDRPRVLVVACSDGRLQEATDEFLADTLGIHRYDRLYVPGGAGALSCARGDFVRAHELRRECRFLIEAHRVEHLVLLFHGPAPDGPAEAVCADYRRVHAWASPAQVHAEQAADVVDLVNGRGDFAMSAALSIYRVEVNARRELAVAALHAGAAVKEEV